MNRKIKRYGWTPDAPDHRDLIYQVPLKLTLPSQVDLRSKCPPVYDQKNLGSCFPAGTRVRLEDGTNCPIEAVKPLQKVLTAEGGIGRVLSVMARDHAGEMVHLELWGHNFLRLTPEHPVLTKNRGYVKASELALSDFVGIPRYLPCQNEAIYTEAHVTWRERIRGVGTRHYRGVARRATATASVTAIPDALKLTPGLGRIIGLFLAEGNTEGGKVVFTLGYKEMDTLAAELLSLLKSELGVEGRKQVRGNSAVKVIVYGTAWAKLFESLCSTGAGQKRLHVDIASGPKEFMEAMMGGWLSGDGWHNEKRGGVGGLSISHDLALSMYNISTALGQRPSIAWRKPTLSIGVKTRQPTWTVEIIGKSDNWRNSQDDTHCWRKIRKISREEFSGSVFNLSVEGDQSYTAEGIGVHNCTANAVGAAYQFDMYRQLGHCFRPSRLFIYYNERAIEGTVRWDSGAMLRDGIKSVVETGVCGEADWPYTVSKFALKPPASCYATAQKNQAVTYRRIMPTIDDMKSCLAQGRPFVFGFSVFESFESDEVARTGLVPMPGANEAMLGGHAVMCVGYFDATRQFIVRNSWGSAWGQAGYCLMSYDYLANPNLADDRWTVTTVEDGI